MKETKPTRGGRVAAFVTVTVISLVAFAALGGVGLAQSAIGLAQYQYGKKVTICHKGKNAIRISVRAWPAHKRHGDAQGNCVIAKHAKKKHHEKTHAEREHSDAGKEHGKVAGTKQGQAAGKQQGKAERGREAVAQQGESSGNGKRNGNESRSGNGKSNGSGSENGKGRGK
jgi:uncharacterized membrane protein YgcG